MNRGDVMLKVKGPAATLTWMAKKAVQAAGTHTLAPSAELPDVNRRNFQNLFLNTTNSWGVLIAMIK